MKQSRVILGEKHLWLEGDNERFLPFVEVDE